MKTLHLRSVVGCEALTSGFVFGESSPVSQNRIAVQLVREPSRRQVLQVCQRLLQGGVTMLQPLSDFSLDGYEQNSHKYSFDNMYFVIMT